MAVAVPQGMPAGDMPEVHTSAGVMQVEIPQGVGPGQHFEMPMAQPMGGHVPMGNPVDSGAAAEEAREFGPLGGVGVPGPGGGAEQQEEGAHACYIDECAFFLNARLPAASRS